MDAPVASSAAYRALREAVLYRIWIITGASRGVRAAGLPWLHGSRKDPETISLPVLLFRDCETDTQSQR